MSTIGRDPIWFPTSVHSTPSSHVTHQRRLWALTADRSKCDPGSFFAVGWPGTNTTWNFLLCRTMVTDHKDSGKPTAWAQQKTLFAFSVQSSLGCKGTGFFLHGSGRRSMTAINIRRATSEPSCRRVGGPASFQFLECDPNDMDMDGWVVADLEQRLSCIRPWSEVLAALCKDLKLLACSCGAMWMAWLIGRPKWWM